MYKTALRSNRDLPLMVTMKKGDDKKPLAYRSRSTVLVAVLLSVVFAFSRAPFYKDYALCSPSNDIYTVDETRPRVECVVIRGSHILDTGKKGQYSNMS